MTTEARWHLESTGPGPPIVGRSTERALLRSLLEAVEQGDGRFCIIGGEAGIGKTTLVRDIIRMARERGMQVLGGQCYDLTATPPYGLWLDLAGNHALGDDTGIPFRLPELLARDHPRGFTSQAEIFGEVRRFLADVSTARPTLVVLEDVHWADPVSLELMRSIASHLERLPLLLLATYREDELTRSSALYAQLPALVRESGGERIDLGHLTRDDLTSIVDTYFPFAPADRERLVDFLVEHSDGNPFFAVELLRALEQRGQNGGLWRSDGGWVLGDLADLVVPSLIRQIIDNRVERLGASSGLDLRGKLELAAVIGQDVPLDLWRELAEADDASMLQMVEVAVDRHLLLAAPDGTRVQFVHALTREALYERILPPRRRVLHRDIAEALIAQGDAVPDAVAYHLRQAGDPRAAEWMIRAGDRAQRAYAWLTAWERFAAAADALADVPDEESLRARLLYRCGRLVRYADAARGIEGLRLAQRLAVAGGEQALAADALYSQGLLQCFAGSWPGAIEMMQDGLRRLEAIDPPNIADADSSVTWLADALPSIGMARTPGPDPVADRLAAAGVSHRRGSLPWFLAHTGRFRDAAREADSFLAHVGPGISGPLVQSATGHATFGLAIARAGNGDPAGAREAFTDARRIYGEIDHHAVIAFTCLIELQDVAIRYETTDLAGRDRLAAEAEASLERAGGALPAGLSPAIARIPLMWIKGRWNEAKRLASEAGNTGNYVLSRTIATPTAFIDFSQGNVDAVRAHIGRILPRGPDTEPGSAVLWDALQLQVLASYMALEAGDRAFAATWLDANRRWLGWSDSVPGQAEHWTARAWFSLSAGDLDGAMDHAERAVAASAKPFQPWARIDALRARGAVVARRREIEPARRDLGEALSLADACGSPFQRAQVLVDAIAAGTDHPAGRLEEAREIASRLQAAPLLSRIALLAPRDAPAFGLTERELDVLRLAAEGLTDAAIGEQLFISHRTVSQHLRSIYGKLDVRSRAAATRFAIEHGLL
jgi:DNA-binding CsgD family transcriptional regulator